jgi:hypothetical protein
MSKLLRLLSRPDLDLSIPVAFTGLEPFGVVFADSFFDDTAHICHVVCIAMMTMPCPDVDDCSKCIQAEI